MAEHLAEKLEQSRAVPKAGPKADQWVVSTVTQMAAMKVALMDKKMVVH